MKIINFEDEKKVAYVQLNDIMMLMRTNSLIPAEVMEKCFNEVFIVVDENRFEFKRFEDEGCVEFFEGCDWIPDYRIYREMSEEQIIADGQEIAEEMNQVAKKWNAMTEDEREKHSELADRHEKLEHKMHSTAEILWTKQGHRVMPFPVVPDYKGFTLDNDDSIYMAQQGINPLQVLLFRKDGKKLSNTQDTNIPMGLIQGIDSLLIMHNTEKNEFFGNVERTRELSDDKKYFVTTFKIIPKMEDVKEQNMEVKTNDVMVKRKTIGTRIKDWLNGLKK